MVQATESIRTNSATHFIAVTTDKTHTKGQTMNIWKSIKKFFTSVKEDAALKTAADTALEAAKEVAVDYVKDKAKQEIQRHK
ncbi:hypothetical protein HNP12_000192 [Aeromonas hydrophila]|uniref:hypothetical protein n=1 Tax=Aeromonas hydrophila TaxID=644 RepID=UPI002168F227|nr:hypothetical protein [Aeromonas hydrophila]MCS3766153.1 hypothetical protein [Aeromonas hydrophila]